MKSKHLLSKSKTEQRPEKSTKAEPKNAIENIKSSNIRLPPPSLRAPARAQEFTIDGCQGTLVPGANIGANQVRRSPDLLFLFVLDNFGLLDFRLRSRHSRFLLSRQGRDWLLLVEGGITVIDAVQALPGVEHLGSKPLMKRVPPFHSNESLAAEEQRQQLTLPAEVGHLPVNVLIFNQAPDLTVDHPVKLGDQDDIKPKLSMLRKEGKPLGPAVALPFPGIKEQLALVDHQKD